MKTLWNATGVKPIPPLQVKSQQWKKQLQTCCRWGLCWRTGVADRSLQDHLPSRRAETLIRAINFAPGPDAPTKCQAEHTTFPQPSKDLAHHCLSPADHPRASQSPVLDSRRAGWPKQDHQNQTNLSHSPILLLRLLTASSSIPWWSPRHGMICRTFEQVPSSSTEQ